MKKVLHFCPPVKWFTIFLFLFLAWSSAFGQTRTITGTVRSSQAGVPDVSVVIKNTTNGTVTDSLGKYLLQARTGDILVFTSANYKPVEIEVGANTSVVDATLTASIATLNEVTVIGYGSQARRNVTGSVTKVDMKTTQNLPNTNITQALRGRVAGVQFTDNGRPGQNGSILIRGPRSLSASNNPLIILDGIFFNGSLTDINPTDIESMEVLKDASSAAIYGSRAANGVILISSKKGVSETPTLNFNAMYGVSDWSKRLKLLSPERYLQKQMDIRRERGIAYNPNDVSTYLTITEADNYKNGRFIDPYDMISQSASVFAADVSYAGKTRTLNYFVSGAMTNEQGLVYNDIAKRKSVRINLTNQVTQWLNVGTNTLFSETDFSGTEAEVALALRQSPLGTWYRPDGTPTQFTVPEDGGISGNPLRNAFLQQDKNIRTNLFANFFGIVSIPGIQGLTFRVNYSKNFRWIQQYNATRQDIYLTTNNTSASKYNFKANDYVLENILDYKLRLGDDHAFDVTLMYGSNKNQGESTTASASQLPSDVLGWNNLQSGANILATSGAEQITGVSSMARINYRFKGKYLLTLTARRDGSSVFAENQKYATFPSASLAWIASDETFLQNVKFLDFLKVRLSYGAVGNQAISPYQSLSLASTNNYVFSDGAGTSIGIYPSNISNANLKWETTYSGNLGIDFSVLSGRIGGTIELYNMDTKNLLVQRSLPIMTGYTSIWTNLGQINNKGIEITLNTVNIKSKKFEWSTNFVFSHNKNKIVRLYGSDVNGDGKEDDDLGNRWFIGQPINVLYDYVFDGIYQKGDVLPAGYLPGFARFKDLNGDGIVNAANDRTFVGQGSQPKFRWGITNTFAYGDLALSVFINAMQGWLGEFNQMDYYFDSVDPLRPANMFDSDWWTPDNTATNRPSLEYRRSVLGHSWYGNRSFIRIQDVSLTYSVPAKLYKKIGLSSLSAYASGKNLATFTNWPGTNPEVITSFPIARTFAFGIRAGF